MKNVFKRNMKFEAKGIELKAGRNLLGRPYASATVSEGTLAAGVIIGGSVVIVTGAGKICKKAGKLIGGAVHNMTSKKKPAAQEEEDFMEQ